MKRITQYLAASVNEECLLSYLNIARLEDWAIQRIRLCLETEIQWDIFFDLMELNAVIPLTLSRIQELGVSVPHSDRFRLLQEKARDLRIQSERRMTKASQLIQVLHERGIEVILLKGGLLSPAIYQDRSYKKMNDVDILIRFERAEETVNILKELGFSSVGALLGKKDISDKNHHCPPFVSEDLACVIGVHWGLHSRFSPWKSDTDALWQRKVSIIFEGVGAYRMSWEDNLLHLCFHLPFYKIGLRELADVFNLVLFCEPSIDWNVFSERAVQWKVSDPVCRVLLLARAIMPFDVAEPMLDRFQQTSSRLCREDTRRRLNISGLLFRSRSVHIAKIEKAFAVFQISNRSSEKVKAWAKTWTLTLWPNEEEVKKLSGYLSFRQPWDRVIARIQAPRLIWCAMARDFGHVALTLITLINFVKVIGIILKAPFGKQGSLLANHPARQLLEVLE